MALAISRQPGGNANSNNGNHNISGRFGTVASPLGCDRGPSSKLSTSSTNERGFLAEPSSSSNSAPADQPPEEDTAFVLRYTGWFHELKPLQANSSLRRRDLFTNNWHKTCIALGPTGVRASVVPAIREILQAILLGQSGDSEIPFLSSVCEQLADSVDLVGGIDYVDCIIDLVTLICENADTNIRQPATECLTKIIQQVACTFGPGVATTRLSKLLRTQSPYLQAAGCSACVGILVNARPGEPRAEYQQVTLWIDQMASAKCLTAVRREALTAAAKSVGTSLELLCCRIWDGDAEVEEGNVERSFRAAPTSRGPSNQAKLIASPTADAAADDAESELSSDLYDSEDENCYYGPDDLLPRSGAGSTAICSHHNNYNNGVVTGTPKRPDRVDNDQEPQSTDASSSTHDQPTRTDSAADWPCLLEVASSAFVPPQVSRRQAGSPERRIVSKSWLRRVIRRLVAVIIDAAKCHLEPIRMHVSWLVTTVTDSLQEKGRPQEAKLILSVQNKLMSLFRTLAVDECWLVRLSVRRLAAAMFDAAAMVSTERIIVRSATAGTQPVITAVLTPQVEVLELLLDALGDSELEVQIVAVNLLSSYLQERAPTSLPEHLENKFIQHILVALSHSECNINLRPCLARNLLGLSIIVPPKKAIEVFYDSFHSFVRDPSPEVRLELLKSFCVDTRAKELASQLEDTSTSQLVLSDDGIATDDVKSGDGLHAAEAPSDCAAIQRGDVLRHLLLEHFESNDPTTGIPYLAPALEINELDWRQRRAFLIYSLALLADINGKSPLAMYIAEFALQYLNDDVWAVRIAAARGLEALIRCFGVEWFLGSALFAVDSLTMQPTYLARVTATYCFQAIVLSAYGNWLAAQGSKHTLHQMLRVLLTLSETLADDRVSNVRLSFFRSIVQCIKKIPDGTLPPKLLKLWRDLANRRASSDGNLAVMSAAGLAQERLRSSV